MTERNDFDRLRYRAGGLDGGSVRSLLWRA